MNRVEQDSAMEGEDDIIPIDTTFLDEPTVEGHDETSILWPDEPQGLDLDESLIEDSDEELIEYTESIEDELDTLRGDQEDLIDSDRPLPDEPRDFER